MKSLAILFISLFLLPGIVFPQPEDQDRKVEVTGEGPSRIAALTDAKRNAIEQGIGTMLRSQTEVNNFILQKDQVITHCQGAVKRYKVLSEKEQDGAWQVHIQAVVSMGTINSDLMSLKILLNSMDKPRTMVLIREQGGSNAQNRIEDYLLRKGFDIVDAAQTAALMDVDPSVITQALDGDPAAVAQMGKQKGAEYMIVGLVNKRIMSGVSLISDSGMQSGQASLTVRVINCSNARIIASKSANSAAIHISGETAQAQAAAKAADTLMDNQLFEAIIGSFKDTVNNGASFEVTVQGINSYSMQKEATAVFEQCNGVVSVNRRYFSGQELGITVLFKGSADLLCDQVNGKTMGNAVMKVTQIAGNRISVQVQ
ncbi:hypothetical protein [uncultured Desulfobacter sp.]|uniref:hypothetical protein n=1 Tax=uncultured Desulfobacter sp. TaxID=240139 RepID=UPI002AAA7CC0|nr:hypothetical protein [uncultured Desulfobacter sp.]